VLASRLIGLHGIYIDDPAELGTAWEAALNAGAPTVLEVRTDPDVPPLPPHITLEQAKNFMFALANDVDRSGVLARTADQVLAAVLPSKH
jgi:pyruvate dehydrogenase (quinone)